MEFGTAVIEVVKKTAEAAKKVNDIQQKLDKVTKPVEIIKKITEDKTGNYAGDIIAGKTINNIKASLSDSLSKYFQRDLESSNNGVEDTGNQKTDTNYNVGEVCDDNNIYVADKTGERPKLENILGDYFDSKEASVESVDNPLDNKKLKADSEDSEDSESAVEAKRIPTRNERLEGQTHPETGVPFKTKVVENCEGELVEVVVPEFDSEFEAKLPEELHEANDNVQFDECNNQLKDAIENDPELREKFTDEQIELILDGETPDGFTWHHDAEKGKIQLVDSDVHAKTGHTGGKSIWGGGSENR